MAQLFIILKRVYSIAILWLTSLIEMNVERTRKINLNSILVIDLIPVCLDLADIIKILWTIGNLWNKLNVHIVWRRKLWFDVCFEWIHPNRKLHSNKHNLRQLKELVYFMYRQISKFPMKNFHGQFQQIYWKLFFVEQIDGLIYLLLFSFGIFF